MISDTYHDPFQPTPTRYNDDSVGAAAYRRTRHHCSRTACTPPRSCPGVSGSRPKLPPSGMHADTVHRQKQTPHPQHSTGQQMRKLVYFFALFILVFYYETVYFLSVGLLDFISSLRVAHGKRAKGNIKM